MRRKEIKLTRTSITACWSFNFWLSQNPRKNSWCCHAHFLDPVMTVACNHNMLRNRVIDECVIYTSAFLSVLCFTDNWKKNNLSPNWNEFLEDMRHMNYCWGRYLSNIVCTWAIFNFRLKSKWVTLNNRVNSFLSGFLVPNNISTIWTVAAITELLFLKAFTVPNK